MPTERNASEELRAPFLEQQRFELLAVALRVQRVRRELREPHRALWAVRDQCVERPDSHATCSVGVTHDVREY